MVAERQGQVAALNILGEQKTFRDAPFFWSAHYGSAIRYVGHARHWDAAEIEGDLKAGKAVVRYLSDGRIVAVAAIGQDREVLRAAVSLERTPGAAQVSGDLVACSEGPTLPRETRGPLEEGGTVLLVHAQANPSNVRRRYRSGLRTASMGSTVICRAASSAFTGRFVANPIGNRTAKLRQLETLSG